MIPFVPSAADFAPNRSPIPKISFQWARDVEDRLGGQQSRTSSEGPYFDVLVVSLQPEMWYWTKLLLVIGVSGREVSPGF